jgi:sugar phosphate isomerase/epimerase
MPDTTQIAAQLYTVRDFTQTADGFAETLGKISKIGYKAVQISGVQAMAGDAPEVSAAEARRMLDDLGLACIATHRSWDDLRNRTDQEIEFHQILGCDFTAVGSLPGEYQGQGAVGYAAFVQDAQPVIAELRAAGIRFGYHNHAFEFARAEGTGQALFETFVEHGGPDFHLEIDVYWAAHAGWNPQRLVERCRGRVPVIHVKDREMAGQEPVMAPVGEGNLDWAHLLPACAAAGVEWYAVEQDHCRRDPFDCLRSSFEFLRGAK